MKEKGSFVLSGNRDRARARASGHAVGVLSTHTQTRDKRSTSSRDVYAYVLESRVCVYIPTHNILSLSYVYIRPLDYYTSITAAHIVASLYI